MIIGNFFGKSRKHGRVATRVSTISNYGIPAITRFVVFLVPAVLLSACVTLTPSDTAQWRTSQTKVLKERAKARWKALIKGDFKTAYGYTSPAYRAVVPLQQYKGHFGTVVQWKLARVKDVRYDEPTVASVIVDVTYRTELPTFGDYESNRQMHEKWLYENGKWWYTPKLE